MCESVNVLALEIYGGILVSITGLGRALRMRWMWWSEVGLGAENMPGMGCGGVECCGVMGCGTNHYSRVGSTHTLCNRCVSVWGCAQNDRALQTPFGRTMYHCRYRNHCRQYSVGGTHKEWRVPRKTWGTYKWKGGGLRKTCFNKRQPRVPQQPSRG